MPFLSGLGQCSPTTYGMKQLHNGLNRTQRNEFKEVLTRNNFSHVYMHYEQPNDRKENTISDLTLSSTLNNTKYHYFDEVLKLLNTHPKTKQSRHKRETNGGGFLDDPNNIAMFIVFPCMVFIYGGCAVLYCCYKCRNYVREHQPIRQLKDRIRNRKNKTTENSNNTENIENGTLQHNRPIPRVLTPNRPADKPLQSESLIAQSSIESRVTFIDVENEEVHSNLSTPLADSTDIAERSPTSESRVHTDTSVQSYPSLSTVSTRIDSPFPKSVSTQSEPPDNRHIFTSVTSEHVLSFDNHINLVDIGCQTDNSITNIDYPKSTITIKSRVGKMSNRKRKGARTNPGQIHFVKNYVPLNPYRDQGPIS